jgi:hypothetical protein
MPRFWEKKHKGKGILLMGDLIRYLTYKIGEAERIRNEGKQMNLF